MKTIIINDLNIKYIIIKLLCIFIFSITLISCEDEDLVVSKDLPFSISVLPVPKEVANGQCVEIRLSIRPGGNYNDTKYYIRYFQFDGQGALQYYDDPPLLPNDLYELRSKEFRLYYTSLSSVSQSFSIWITDSFGNEHQESFSFNSSD